ncbi:uncharacterized protein PFL1_06410 [Pseudozyma flocculosa PF-1]|uniref:Uncharacterized protein n=2 Tax=Pseudozyma flocculosa TaxID=84751 RepID=A0A5C3ETW8_9BASI|nr:uncharacterized protein PFL1_06410 [Pseudozyma flocculosa PF-1]EPQ25954.1 hypothetical protein PFL1_06410 [Pseudozyma flocculosa PF-1]SPO35748.1 uncharacterized protein PSFLO_01219 [Pseudozyma flocculosa]
MSSPPPKQQSSVPPKAPGHDSRPLYSRLASTSKRFIGRDPQLAPLAFVSEYGFLRKLSSFGTVAVAAYWYSAKVRGTVTEDRMQKSGGADVHAAGAAPTQAQSLGAGTRSDYASPKTTPNDGTLGRKIKELAADDRAQKNRDQKDRVHELRDEVGAKKDEWKDAAKQKIQVSR